MFRRPIWRPLRSESGESLVEILAALLLLGSTVLLLVQGIATVVALSEQRQLQANVSAAARAITEALNGETFHATLSVAAAGGDKTITVTSTSGLPSTYPFVLGIDSGTGFGENVSVTSASGNVLTVSRGVDGTSATAHSVGSPVSFSASSCSNTSVLAGAIAVPPAQANVVEVSVGPAYNQGHFAVETALTAAVTSSATSITVTSTSGFPVATPYSLMLDPGLSSAETVSVTGVSGTTLAVARGQGGTTAVAHASGAVVGYQSWSIGSGCPSGTDTGLLQVLFTLKATAVSTDGKATGAVYAQQVAVLLGAPRA